MARVFILLRCLFNGLSVSYVDREKWEPLPSKSNTDSLVPQVLPSCTRLPCSPVHQRELLFCIHSFVAHLPLQHIWLHVCLFLKQSCLLCSYQGPKREMFSSYDRLEELGECVSMLLWRWCFHGSWKRRSEEEWDEAECSRRIVRQCIGQGGLHVSGRWSCRDGRHFVVRWWRFSTDTRE